MPLTFWNFKKNFQWKCEAETKWAFMECSWSRQASHCWWVWEADGTVGVVLWCPRECWPWIKVPKHRCGGHRLGGREFGLWDPSGPVLFRHVKPNSFTSRFLICNTVMDREVWHAVHGVTKSRTRLRDWTELIPTLWASQVVPVVKNLPASAG